MIFSLHMMSETAQEGVEPVTDASGITLLEDEEAYVNTRPSYAGWLGQNLGLNILLMIVTFGLWLLVGFIWQRMARYVVTNQRVYRKVGILSQKTDEYRYEDIQQVSTGKSLAERLLGVGNVKLQTGTGGQALVFWGVPDVDAMANVIRSQMRDR